MPGSQIMNRLQKALIVTATAIFLWIGSCKLPIADNVGSDPSATLLTAESLIQHGSVNLNHYPRAILERRGTYQIVGRGEGKPKKLVDTPEEDPVFYFYPPGSPISAIPAAWISNKLGISFVDFSNEVLVQRILSGSIFTVNYITMVLMGSSICGFLPAVVLALAWSLGSSLLSTGISALWSHDFAIFYAFLAINALYGLTIQQDLLISGKTKINSQRTKAFLAGIFSIAAFACRPGMILLTGCGIGYIASTKSIRNSMLSPYIGGLLVALTSFWIFSQAQYESFVPPYYLMKLSPHSISEATGAIVGLLLSPSRGLFIFTPISAFYSLLCIWIWKKEGFKNWMIFAIVWPLLQLILLSRWPGWWGGASYGPRLLMDIIPGMAFGSFFVESELKIIRWPLQKNNQLLLKMLLGCAIYFSVIVHSSPLIGSNAIWKYRWNTDPIIDKCAEVIWDWRYPQFIHNQIRHQQRLQELKQGRYTC